MFTDKDEWKKTIEIHAGRFKYTAPARISEIHRSLFRNQEIISLNVGVTGRARDGDGRQQKMTEPRTGTIEIRTD